MVTLARKLRLTDYFSLGFGTMVGSGWLVVMDDWLRRGGPLGGVLGYAVGGALLLPFAYVYGRLVTTMPDASAEIAYTARVFPGWVSYAVGWMMVLAYFVVVPWEAVVVGKVAAYIFHTLDSMELYRVAGSPVYLPHLALGLGLTALLAVLNYRGIRLSASFQNWTTFGVLGLFVVFVSCGVTRGAAPNFTPLFSHPPLVSVLLVIQIVPFFMTGFESVPKCAEESSPGFRERGFFVAMVLAVVVGILFYAIVIAAVAYVAPWPSLTGEKFATAIAFERAVGSHWIVNLILAAAILSLFKVANGNYIASSRLVFALGRRGLVDERLGRIHPANQTPWVAVAAVAAASAVLTFFGDAILIPVTEVGSVASAVGWLASSAAFWRMRPGGRGQAVALAGILVGAALILMKVLPFVPGHFTVYEYVALAIWVLAGWTLKRRDKHRYRHS